MGRLAEVRELPVGRVFLVDDRGRGLRASWHLEHGLVNLSIWRGERCVETFHLSIADAASLAGLLVEGLGEAAAGHSQRRASQRSTGRRVFWNRPEGDVAFTRALRIARARLATWIAP